VSINNILHPILQMPGWEVYLVVGALVFAEDAIMVGFVFPGETAAIFGGVAAAAGHASIEVIVPLVVCCAILGDSVGYLVGDKAGPKILGFRPLRKRRASVQSALDLVKRRGMLTVFVGRFTAFLRAVVPGLAGMSGLQYRRFLLANAAGGLIWGVGYTMIGYAVGHAYQKIERILGDASYGVLAAVVIGYIALTVWSRRREKRHEAELEAKAEDGGSEEHPANGDPAPAGLSAGGAEAGPSSGASRRVPPHRGR
jgi:membrane-associated protein